MADAEWLEHQLRNWGRWAASWREQLGVPEPPYCADYRAGAAWEPGWGDRDAAPASVLPPVDEAAALRMDRALRRLARCHLVTLRRHYVERSHAPELELGAAVRALGDVMAGRLEVP